MTRFSSLSIAASLLLAPPAAAQVLIDIGAQAGTPSTTYAVGGIPNGPFTDLTWNTVSAGANAVPLLYASGAPSGVTITITGGSAYSFDHPGTSGDDQALMDDGSRSAGTQIITLAGMDSAECGWDEVYVLGLDASERTRVRLFYDSPASVEHEGGGAWPGNQSLGATFVRNEGDWYCDFATDMDLVIEISPALGSPSARSPGSRSRRAHSRTPSAMRPMAPSPPVRAAPVCPTRAVTRRSRPCRAAARAEESGSRPSLSSSRRTTARR
jgi:hypothetical protein